MTEDSCGLEHEWTGTEDGCGLEHEWPGIEDICVQGQGPVTENSCGQEHERPRTEDSWGHRQGHEWPGTECRCGQGQECPVTGVTILQRAMVQVQTIKKTCKEI